MNPPPTIDFRYRPSQWWTCFGRPDDPHKSLISEQGDLLYRFDRQQNRIGLFRFDQRISFRIQGNPRPLEVTQQTESGRFPLVHTTLRFPRATLKLSTFAHQHHDQLRTDIVLWEITGHDTDFLTGLWLQVQDQDWRYLTASNAPSQRIYAVKPEDVQVQAGSLQSRFYQAVEPPDILPPGPLALYSDPQPLDLASSFDFGPASGLATPPDLVNAATSLKGALFFPQNHHRSDFFSYTWACHALEAERTFWNTFPLFTQPWSIPDPHLADLLEAAARNIFQAREIHHGIPEFQVGPTVYRGLWIVDGHFFLEAARYLGYTEDADRGIDALLRRVRPNGAIEQMPFHAKETGISLATLVRQTQLSGNWNRLEQLWSVVQGAVNHIETLHQASYQHGPQAPEYGLMEVSFGDGGLGGKRPEYTTPLWTLIGLKLALEAAQHLQKTTDIQRIGALYQKLYETLLHHAQRDQQTLPDGTPFFPMNMPGSSNHHWIHDFPHPVPPWHRINPATATWALAHAIYPGQLFPPNHPITTNFLHLLASIDHHQQIPANSGWLPYQALWTYSASFYAHAFLFANQPHKAIQYLYAFANHASPTRTWREEQSFSDSHHNQIFGDMPHNWASVELIRLVRHLLVLEHHSNLLLLPALPPHWLSFQQPIAIPHSPTQFGPVSLRVEPQPQGYLIEVETDPQWPTPAQQILLHIQAFGPLHSLRINGAEHPLYEPVISLPAGKCQIELVCKGV